MDEVSEVAARLHRDSIVVEGHAHVINAVAIQGVDPWRGADRPPARLGQSRLSDGSTQSEAIRTMRRAFGQYKPPFELALRTIPLDLHLRIVGSSPE